MKVTSSAIFFSFLITTVSSEGCALGSPPSTNSWCPGERLWDFKQRRLQELPSLVSTPKYFIISMGPPASGKSSSLGYIQSELKIENEPTLEIIVDDIVESFPNYREEIKKVQGTLEELYSSATARLSSEMREKYSDLSADELKKRIETMEKDPRVNLIPEPSLEVICSMSQKIYFGHRSWADQKSNSLLFEELAGDTPCRHVVYESTGSSTAFDWANRVARMAATHGFIPVLIYPFVDTERLRWRALRRALKGGRLPCSALIGAISRQARSNFVRASEARTSDIGDSPYEKIFLMDNRGDRPVPLAEFSSEGAKWHEAFDLRKCNMPDADFLCKLPGVSEFTAGG